MEAGFCVYISCWTENHMHAQMLDTSFPIPVQQLDHAQSPVRGAVATPVHCSGWWPGLPSLPLPPASFTDLCMHTLNSWRLLVHTVFLFILLWQISLGIFNTYGTFWICNLSGQSRRFHKINSYSRICSKSWIESYKWFVIQGFSLICPSPAQKPSL